MHKRFKRKRSKSSLNQTVHSKLINCRLGMCDADSYELLRLVHKARVPGTFFFGLRNGATMDSLDQAINTELDISVRRSFA